MTDKERDLAGPGIGSYEELARILPADYRSLLTPRETQQQSLLPRAISRSSFAESSIS